MSVRCGGRILKERIKWKRQSSAAPSPTPYIFPSNHHSSLTPLYPTTNANLSLSRSSRSLFASALSSLAPKTTAAGSALVKATRSTPLNRFEWTSRSSTVNSTVQQTRYASNKDKKNKNMPPKKVVKEEPVQLGRPGNSLNAGIVCTNMYVLCTALPNTSR